MKIFDISQEVFSCAVFPGDPQPEKTVLMRIGEGEVCNLSEFRMCAHNGTHVDAPYHFYDDGKKIDEVALNRFVGYAYVAEHNGELTGADAERILESARKAVIEKESGIAVRTSVSGQDVLAGVPADVLSAEGAGDDASKRILVKGKAVVSEAAAKVFADNHILLYGNESQTVGPEDAPKNVHLTMLGAEIVLLEGIRLGEVEEGIYFLNAAPLNLGGADGAPCRAILINRSFLKKAT